MGLESVLLDLVVEVLFCAFRLKLGPELVSISVSIYRKVHVYMRIV